jgi:hypothetical protein
MAQYVLFSPFYDQETDLLVCPHDTMAKIWGCNPHDNRFQSGRCMDAFSNDVFPLNNRPWDIQDGLARRLSPEYSEIVDCALIKELADAVEGSIFDYVDFTTGERISRRSQTTRHSSYIERVKALADDRDRGRAASDLLDLLNSQPDTTFKKIITHNWPDVIRELKAMPRQTQVDRERVKANLRILRHIQEYPIMKYHNVDHSDRIFTIGATIHQLSRQLRKTILKGTVGIDLKSAQLAIVAKLWNVKSVLRFLDDGGSIWRELLDWLGLDEGCKPLLKRAIYALIFGMYQGCLMRLLEFGTRTESGIGLERAVRFFDHGIIADLLKSRGRQLRSIRSDRGVEDAFGNWIDLKPGRDAKSLLAQQAQSYELDIMLAMCPILDAEQRNVNVVSWLHDGAAIHIQDRNERDRIIRRLSKAIDARADELRIPTHLEVSD